MTAVPVSLPAAARRRRRIARGLRRRPVALAGGGVAALFVLAAIFAPIVAPYDPSHTDFTAVLQGPSLDHLMGTDDLGRDTLSRVIFGARASLTAGVLATLLAIVVAVPLGLVAGYFGGWWDPVISRATDVMLAFPYLVLAVGLAAIPPMLRVTRAQTLALRDQEFVRAAVANGAGDLVILRRHLLPNMASALLVQATVTIPQAILGEALLSFLGLGVQLPTPSWGTMLSAAQPFLAIDAWLAIWPGLAICLATLSFNLFGDGLRDVLDPRSER
jgi:peptide/nickel transport system permease protein